MLNLVLLLLPRSSTLCALCLFSSNKAILGITRHVFWYIGRLLYFQPLLDPLVFYILPPSLSGAPSWLVPERRVMFSDLLEASILI